MFSVPQTVRSIVTSLAFGIVAAGSSAAQAAAPLALKVYNGDAASFHVNSVLVSGPTEAMVIDAGFTRADALRIAASVLDSGKALKVIFISNADPDYYFGASTLKSIFPQARVLTTPAVREKILAKLPGKMAFWGPKMGSNAPTEPLVPDALAGAGLTLDGQAIEVRGASGALAHRPYLWIPSIKAIVGNIAVFGELHVWTADTQQASERQQWLKQLDEMETLAPAMVVPGHMAAGTTLDASAIAYTRGYLQRFERESAHAKDAAGLKAAMQAAYPNAGLGIALDIGAKVNKGEMQW